MDRKSEWIGKMFDELRYRWALRNFLKEHNLVKRSYEQIPSDLDPDGMNFPKYTAGKELNYRSFLLDEFRSRYLLDQAVRYHVPVPTNDEDWQTPPFPGAEDHEKYLTAAAAQKLRADIGQSKRLIGITGQTGSRWRLL